MPGHDSSDDAPREPRSPRPAAEANRQFAVAVRTARTQAKHTLDEMVVAFREQGVVATRDQIWKWEAGVDPKHESLVIVPAYALFAAARVARVSMGQLLLMAGAGEQDPMLQQLAELRAEMERLQRMDESLRAAVNELRAYQGLPELPETAED